MNRRDLLRTFAVACLLMVPGRAFAASIPDVAVDSDQQWPASPPLTIDPSVLYSVVIKTSLGEMTAELYVIDAPNTVNNFVFLAREGFYNSADKAHEAVTGRELPPRTRPSPTEPAGEPWDEDDLEAMYPKLWARFA
jgi:hypothetical protein